jgi:hypothetical protein
MTTGDQSFLINGCEYVMSLANGVVLLDEYECTDEGPCYSNCFTAQLLDLEDNPRIQWDDPEPAEAVRDEVRGRLLG